MAELVKVKENETLFQIAREKGFNVFSLVKANIEKWPFLSRHTNVLVPDMEIIIPDKQQKKVKQSTGTDTSYTVVKSPKQHLSFSFDDKKNEIQNVELTIQGNSLEIIELPDQSFPKRVFKTKDPLPDDLPVMKENDQGNKLKLKIKEAATGEETTQEIFVNVGGLDAILDPAGTPLTSITDNVRAKKAVQKLLRNIGLYGDEIDGDLDKKESVDALSSFQVAFMNIKQGDNRLGSPGFDTLVNLAKQQGLNQMGPIQPLKVKAPPPTPPAPPPPPQKIPVIEIIRKGSPLTTSIGFGRFDAAFEAVVSNQIHGSTQLFNTSPKTFIDDDSGSFSIRITDDASKGKSKITASWFASFDKDGKSTFELGINNNIELLPTTAGGNIFESKKLMIIRDKNDLGAPTTTEVDGVRHGNENYRLRIGGMFGFLHVDYPKAAPFSKEIIATADRRSIFVNLFAFLGDMPDGANDFFAQEIADRIGEASDVYESLGIFLHTEHYAGLINQAGVKKKKAKNNNVEYIINIINPKTFTGSPKDISGIDANSIKGSDVIKLGTVFAPAPHNMRLFFIFNFNQSAGASTPFSQFQSTVDAVSIPESIIRGKTINPLLLNCSFLKLVPRNYEVAHEMGHLIMDKQMMFLNKTPAEQDALGPNLSHYHGRSTDRNFITTGFPPKQNLMSPDIREQQDILAGKRIWDVDDKNGFNWYKSLQKFINRSNF